MKCVETHTQQAQTEKQVNKYQIQNTENRNPFSYQRNHSWGAQTNSVRKPRMPERHRKNLKLSRKFVQVKPLGEMVTEITPRCGAEPVKTENCRSDPTENYGDKLL